MIEIVEAGTDEVPADLLRQARQLMDVAFGDDPEEAFGDDDWEHGLGGVHVLVVEDGVVLTHAALVERTLHAGERPLRTGYVEAVATHPDVRGRGLARLLVSEIASGILARGETPFLHVWADNVGAIRLYETLGFSRRATIHFNIMRRLPG